MVSCWNLFGYFLDLRVCLKLVACCHILRLTSRSTQEGDQGQARGQTKAFEFGVGLMDVMVLSPCFTVGAMGGAWKW